MKEMHNSNRFHLFPLLVSSQKCRTANHSGCLEERNLVKQLRFTQPHAYGIANESSYLCIKCILQWMHLLLAPPHPFMQLP